MPDWQAALKKEVTTSELREQSIHAHGVMLQAIGHVGADLVARKPKTWQKSLKQLKKIDWACANDEWEGRAMIHGRISKARTNVIRTGNYIKHYLNIPLNNIEDELEQEFGK
jgi:DNA sulfur modification protein DndB